MYRIIAVSIVVSRAKFIPVLSARKERRQTNMTTLARSELSTEQTNCRLLDSRCSIDFEIR